MQFEILQTRDTLGTITDVQPNPFDLALFVTRDSGYKYAMNILDDAATKLASAGSSFPFTLGPGFGSAVAGANFNTPATFLQFNRALKARVARQLRDAGRRLGSVAGCADGVGAVVPQRGGNIPNGARCGSVRHVRALAGLSERADAGHEHEPVRSYVDPDRRAASGERSAGRALLGEGPHGTAVAPRSRRRKFANERGLDARLQYLADAVLADSGHSE